jgi:flagellar export protein FliJ
VAREAFRLEQVLELRRQREEQEQLALRALLDEQRSEQDRLEQLRSRQQSHIAAIAARARAGAFDAAELEQAQRYLDRLAAEIEAQTLALAHCESRVEAQRTALMQALQGRRALEQLKEQHEEATRLDERRAEAKVADDIATTRFVRRER